MLVLGRGRSRPRAGRPAAAFMALTVVAALLGACSSLRLPDSDAPDVVLISIDTLRADHLGTYGNAQANTPTIDRLAAEGVTFERVVSPAPITLPAHTTMLTGLIPPHHGVRNNRAYRLPDEVTTLPERLKAAGYQTAGFIGGYPLIRANGLYQGFDVYDDDFGALDQPAAPLLEPEGTQTHFERPAGAVVDSAKAWLGTAAARRPLFIFIHLFDPHEPYTKAMPGADQPSYDGEVAYADRAIGDLLSTLSQVRGDRHRLIIVTGDHGEGLGEHEELTHGLLVYESTLHVPLIVHDSAHTASPRRISAVVGLVDIAPTILDLLGLPAPEGMDGQSLVGLMHGDQAQPRAFYFESLLGELDWGWAPLKGIRLGNLKYIESPEPELYDLAADTHEQTNLLPDQASQMPELAARLQAIGPGTHAGTVSGEKAAQVLASLGYMAAPPAPSQALPSGTRPSPKDYMRYYEQYREVFRLRSIGQQAQALGIMQALEPVSGSSAFFHLQWGDIAVQSGFLDVAQRQYQRAIELDPSLQEAWLNLGFVYTNKGEPEKALRQYEALLELNPNHPEALRNAGMLKLRFLNDPAGGRRYLERYLEVTPEAP